MNLPKSFIEKSYYGYWDELLKSKIIVKGPDAFSFLQGQTTNDLKLINKNETQYNTFLNRQGRIDFFVLVTKISEQEYWVWLDDENVLKCSKRLEDYIIADDVLLDYVEEQKYFIVNSLLNLDFGDTEFHEFLYYNEKVKIAKVLPLSCSQLPQISDEEKKYLKLCRGFFLFENHDKQSRLFNETIAIELAWSKNKGCFLGQEVVQKIYSRRGAAKFPYLLELGDESITCEQLTKLNIEVADFFNIENKRFAAVMLPREFQLDQFEIKFESLNTVARVHAINVEVNLLDEIYHYAINLFSIESKTEEAIEWLKTLTNIAPKNPDYRESLGAIYGKMGENEKAIEQMKIVSELLPDEVMPFTNMSLYAMKLGKIEEAEKFKEEATVRTFLKLGQAAKLKKNEDSEATQVLQREKMFLDVLEIDEFDEMALCGLAEIDLMKKNPENAKIKIEKLLIHNERVTKAYLILGQCYEMLGQLVDAKKEWTKGINLALSRGEMIPAQQMQSFLLKYSR